MAEVPKTIRLMVVTPARIVLDEAVVNVVFPAFDGEWGVLANHAALLAKLGAGPLRVARADARRCVLAVRGGFVQVKGNTVAVLTPECVPAEELNRKELEKEAASLRGVRVPHAEREAHEQKTAWLKARRKALEVHGRLQAEKD